VGPGAEEPAPLQARGGEPGASDHGRRGEPARAGGGAEARAVPDAPAAGGTGTTSRGPSETRSEERAALEAAPGQGQGRGRGPGAWGGPPPQMLEACEGKKEGDDCSFTSPRTGGEMEGTCQPRRDAPEQMACRPSGRGRPGGFGRPGSGDGG
jgi:hypothetical protein